MAPAGRAGRQTILREHARKQIDIHAASVACGGTHCEGQERIAGTFTAQGAAHWSSALGPKSIAALGNDAGLV